MSSENMCTDCGKQIDVGDQFCLEHRGNGLLSTYHRFNSSEAMTSLGIERQTVLCKFCGFNIMMNTGYCFICQYDFDTDKIRISYILSSVSINFLKERKKK